jgi:hypothetical protein
MLRSSIRSSLFILFVGALFMTENPPSTNDPTPLTGTIPTVELP